MRDLVAAFVAVGLAFVALSLATALHWARRRRTGARAAETNAGRSIIAEIPGDADLVLFTEDAQRFYYGRDAVDKSAITAVRVLINGSPIAAAVSERHPRSDKSTPTSFEDRPDGIARDRWDVAIETTGKTMLVECGAIRERVSQELARAVFDAVKASL